MTAALIALTAYGLPLAACGMFAGAYAAATYVPLVGKPMATALVALGVGVLAYDYGYTSRGALDKSEAYRAEIAILQNHLDQAAIAAAESKSLADQANSRAEVAESAAADDQGKIDAFEISRPSAGNSCRLSDADARFLRGLGLPVSPAATSPAAR